MPEVGVVTREFTTSYSLQPTGGRTMKGVVTREFTTSYRSKVIMEHTPGGVVTREFTTSYRDSRFNLLVLKLLRGLIP